MRIGIRIKIIIARVNGINNQVSYTNEIVPTINITIQNIWAFFWKNKNRETGISCLLFILPILSVINIKNKNISTKKT
ncbi:MAG: hypothetical protein N3A71_00590 [Candidatus Dojkabacteria bacterium]|nr:hypothetical protein [Candidatus Dojkabacteria bacterium]